MIFNLMKYWFFDTQIFFALLMEYRYQRCALSIYLKIV